MTIAQIMEKMIAFSEGNIHDIDHLIRVWSYARTIGELEGLDRETQYILEVAAITHDIACPLCREKYGNTNGKYQEAEGAPMVEAFLSGTGMNAAQIERVKFLVGHHHTFSDKAAFLNNSIGCNCCGRINNRRKLKPYLLHGFIQFFPYFRFPHISNSERNVFHSILKQCHEIIICSQIGNAFCMPVFHIRVSNNFIHSG